MHEQARPDRDNYVDIHWNNIKSEYWSQFFKMTPDFWQNTTESYDYKSAMHYEAWAFLNEEAAADPERWSMTRVDNGDPVQPKAKRLTSVDVTQVKPFAQFRLNLEFSLSCHS